MHRKINVNLPLHLSPKAFDGMWTSVVPSRKFKVPANPRGRLEHSATVFTHNPNWLDGFQSYTPIPALTRRLKLNNKNRIADGIHTKLP